MSPFLQTIESISRYPLMDQGKKFRGIMRGLMFGDGRDSLRESRKRVLEKVDFSPCTYPADFSISCCVTRKAIILYFCVISLSKRKLIHIQRRSLRVIIIRLSFIVLAPRQGLFFQRQGVVMLY